MRKRYLGVVVLALAVMVAGFMVSTSAGQRRSTNKAVFAVLDGRSEVNAETGRRNAGDRNGAGSFSAILDGRRLCWGIQVKNIADPSAAHIHRGRPNQAGPVVQALEAPTAGDPGTSGGCTTVSARLARDLLRNPAKYYVNVHNADFPGGAVRGQLSGKAN